MTRSPTSADKAVTTRDLAVMQVRHYAARVMTKLHRFMFDGFDESDVSLSLLDAMTVFNGPELLPILKPLVLQLVAERETDAAVGNLVGRLAILDGQSGFMYTTNEILAACSFSQRPQSSEAYTEQREGMGILLSGLVEATAHVEDSRILSVLRMLAGGIDYSVHADFRIAEMKVGKLARMRSFYGQGYARAVRFDEMYEALLDLLDMLYAIQVKQQTASISLA